MIKHIKNISSSKLIDSTLPSHKVCEDCESFSKCESLFSENAYLEFSKNCKWTPNAFKLSKEEYEIAFIFYILSCGGKVDNINDIKKHFKNWKNIIKSSKNNEYFENFVDKCYDMSKATMKIVRMDETRQKNKKVN